MCSINQNDSLRMFLLVSQRRSHALISFCFVIVICSFAFCINLVSLFFCMNIDYTKKKIVFPTKRHKFISCKESLLEINISDSILMLKPS